MKSKKRLVNVLPFFLTLVVAPADGGAAAQVPGVPLPEPVYEIRMEATYDAEEKLIQGTEWLRWHNTSSVPVSDLQFHHYLNAFANNRSTFMQESGGRLRGDSFDKKRWGWIEVSSLRLANGTDLKGVEEFLAPDDGNAEDRTVARYPLPEPLAPGEWVEVQIEFESQLPTIFARTGAQGDYVLAGQWFPKIAVFEDAGDRGRAKPGWNCHQFHAHSEFFADFGNYDVTLTLPEKYEGKIGATGELVEADTDGGQTTVRFVQKGVHDFAWTADTKFLVIEDQLDPVADVPPERVEKIAALLGKEPSELALPPTRITLLLQPDHLPQKGPYLAAAKAALVGLGLRLGPYPYKTLTVVDPAEGARGSGGMEYPTFITGGTDVLLNLPFFRRIPAATSVTVHEFGHQYFQGMIASNEFEESWIDEGINTFYEMTVMEEAFPKMTVAGVELSGVRRMSIVGSDPPDPILAPAWGYYNGNSYGAASYSRPAIMLTQLERYLGPEVFAQAMRSFFEEYRFHHPTTADFERAIERSSGQDLGWFFRQALHSSKTLDYSIRRISVDEVSEPRGVFWQGGERIELPLKEDGEAEGGGEAKGEDESPELYRSTVVAYREGGFRHPVTVEFRFEDGEVLRRQWDGQRRWRRWTFTRSSKIASAVLDPDGVLQLEKNRLNNGRRTEADRGPTTKLMGQMFFWLQNIFNAAALLG
ncbi:MAG: M1 family metallopeptidase [Acidobacteria bacterium]|nr:M1 family metallopeptidase [Acidobacteriota bacterium]